MAKKIEQVITELLEKTINETGYELVDVEYVREHGEDSANELIIYIDKDGGIDLNDCEKVSTAIDPVIDAADPISESYMLSVSSPGIDRPLKKEKDFLKNIDQKVDIKLYEKLDGKKEHTAVLKEYKGDSITVVIKNTPVEIELKKIALIRPHIDF